jgi:N-acetylglucosamine-6-phosphate deacetylase
VSHHTNIVKIEVFKTCDRPEVVAKTQTQNRTPRLSKDTSDQIIRTYAPVDLHFHGAFGIDLMTASPVELNELSHLLWKKGVGGFCATTLSSPKKELYAAVNRLGRWIRSDQIPGAKPLGIHLEGPFISPGACGAHPPRSIRKLDFSELEDLWDASQETVKILTVAPEVLTQPQLKKLKAWTRAKSIVLSLGHSRITQADAVQAFKNGFQGITHAWNALPFHQREPGALGAALGNPEIYLELIIDQVHVSPTVIRWTRKLHPPQSVCFISDCVPAGGFSQSSKPAAKWHSFGNLKIRYQDDACRLANGSLAGGGHVLTESYIRWLKEEAKFEQTSLAKMLESSIHHLTTAPFRVLGLNQNQFKDRQILWKLKGSHQIDVIPIDSQSANG